MNKLNIFVSSTCYDLSQIRVDMSDFIGGVGHNPVLSEFDNFPVNPQENTIKNCINAVRDSADIMILIVGNRYGSLVDTGKSITNSEFLAAKQKRIPIFVFVDKKTLSALYFYKENKDANFSKFVDSTKVFDFINEIRNDSQLWTFEFEKAQDIVSILKVQLSYLFRNSLKIRAKYEQRIPSVFRLGVSDDAIRILVDKEDLYEYIFFAQVLFDEMQNKMHVYNDYKYSIRYGIKSMIRSNSEIMDWVSNRIDSISNLVVSLGSLVNRALADFLNEPGVPADLNGLFYVAKTYANIYEELLRWSIDTNCTSVPDYCEEVKIKLAALANKVLISLREFPKIIMDNLINAKSSIELNEKVELSLSLKVELDEQALQEYNVEFEKLTLKLLS
ncbi:DUF4062 domain-containing protein [Hymenobacter sp. RP-2-7]|uniref:DUF4062 domain-containing protein n=1 Tax=Hymenobacter polaris TaxID=2682546 RepID=A0A7Y0FMM8_9BACT|nr:DUF4062 domain-containing protein [Hymenobacter polaris]NML65594.1 DUF4062 domain-containing protein [Hymenobacter polaris]